MEDPFKEGFILYIFVRTNFASASFSPKTKLPLESLCHNLLKQV